ncbi:enoyl-CoA hydratase/isomerase family protein [Amorphus sp. 3PC139-8]|uniref:enoyl-CoA hydratase/isomerase family protein n=1 Tax=Amorphus sp. 3PC139-8 TaxID=2735676 RepID=UPI00345D1DF9
MDAETAVPDVLAERVGSLGRIRLNRPKALNSLTLDMVRAIDTALERFETDPDVASILISGEGERGLCAGGDIRRIFDSGRAGDAGAATFWREEYRLNARIARCPKPYVAFMDGIVMGGGVGLSAHGAHRLVTERTKLAMPETGIGFVPDVGGTYLLARSPGELGTYLALTGTIIGAGDAIRAGLADHMVASDRLDEIVETLSELPAGADHQAVDAALDTFIQDAPNVLEENRALIDRAFAADSVEAIVAALEADGSEFAAATRNIILGRSPTSLKLALRLVRLARDTDTLEACLEREFTAAMSTLSGHDFYEGVRAAVIDKDRNPHWQPATLDDVPTDEIETSVRNLGSVFG